MFAIEMLPGGHGDALVIEYGTRTDTHRVLIDGGTANSWQGVRKRLKALPEQVFEAMVVTHVDEDHIGGSLQILNDPDLRSRVRNIWFNGFVHCERGGSVLGPVDGERLTLRINDGPFKWNDPFTNRISSAVGGPVVVSSQGELPAIELPGGALVHLLSPTPPKLKKMAKEWTKVVKAAGLVPGEGTPLEARTPPPRRKKVAPLPDVLTVDALKTLSAPSTTDGSEANGSSIAFIFEFEGRRALLGADAHSDALAGSLQRFGQSTGEQRVRLDLVKLPHHGSRANVTAALIELIDAKRYLISTNGDNFGHPDHAAIARTILGSAQPPTFYCNYRNDLTEPWEERGPSVGATFVLPRDGRAGLRVSATA
ncbi:ComEC/Rec2 family competence protein [Mycobacterium sp. MMS18-G62]